jgi:hypothetical protein
LSKKAALTWCAYLLQTVEGAKRICFVLQTAAEGHTTPEFYIFLSQSSTELLKALTHNIDQVRTFQIQILHKLDPQRMCSQNSGALIRCWLVALSYLLCTFK